MSEEFDFMALGQAIKKARKKSGITKDNIQVFHCLFTLSQCSIYQQMSTFFQRNR